MFVHCELFADVSIAEKYGVELHYRQTTLWPKSLCQSCTSVFSKYHQGWTNAIPICDQRFMGVPHTSCKVFLTQVFLILNEFGYAFNNFRPIPHGVGFARRWFSIREQTFTSIVLTPHEYPFLWGLIKGCAQKLELRVVYCVVTEANFGIMSAITTRIHHDLMPDVVSIYPDGFEFYRILCVIILPHFGHV